MLKGRLFNIRWFAMLFVSLLLGVAFSVNLICGIVAFFILLVITLLCYVKNKRYLLITLILISYLIGFVYSTLLVSIENDSKSYEEGYIRARITESSDYDTSGIVSGRLVLDDISCNGDNLKGKATMYLDDTDEKYHIGDIVMIEGSCMHRELTLDRLGATHDFVNNIRYKIDANSIKFAKKGKLNLRERVVFDTKKILEQSTDKDTAAFLTGMMLGDKSNISATLNATSKRLGIAHLFAVSGLHVAIIAGFIIAILNRLKVKRAYHLLILPFLIFYAYLCGFSVSILRATIMLTIFMLSKALYLRYDMMSSISLTGTILLLVCPMYLFDVSFVMSFLAVLSIALFARPILNFLNRKSDKHRVLKGVFATNISVNIGLFPIMLHLFGGISFLAVPVNLIIIPIISAIFPIFFLLFIVFAPFQMATVIGVIALPFKIIVFLSKLLASVNFMGAYFEVSWYFVATYVIVMIIVSEVVFIDKHVKLVPKIALLSVLIISAFVPMMKYSITGNKIVTTASYSNYYAILKDGSMRDTLIIMGDLDSDSMEKAVEVMNRYGVNSVDTIIVPDAREEDGVMIENYNEIFGANYIVSKVRVDIDGLLWQNSKDNIRLSAYNDIEIDTEDSKLLLVNMSNNKVPNAYKDVILANNKYVKDKDITPKYYKNFAKDSHSERYSYFTIYIKNGKITLN